MRVVLRPSARRDIAAIGDWTAQDNPMRAITFVDELEQRAESLSDMPLRYPVAYESRGGPVHRITHANYLIYYRVLRDHVEILAVRHARRMRAQFD